VPDFAHQGGLLSVAWRERTRSKVGGRKRSGAVFSSYGFRPLFPTLAEFERLPFDEAAALQVDDLRHQKLRIGSRDLKIAATALVNNALRLSTNRTDFFE
jgi:hypothetical protein